MSEPTVTVTRRGADRFGAGHPWIYRSDLVGESRLKLAGGEIVRVVDQRGWFKAKAFYSAKSQIALRQLTREDVACDDAFFAERVRAARSLREVAFPGADAWRAIHGEADLLPGMVVDRYGDYLSVQLLTQGTDARRELFVRLLEEAYHPKAIVERSDAKVRLLEGLDQRKAVLTGQLPERVEYHEGEVRLLVDLMAGQKTGGFLDQRENRLAVRPYARGVGLDCFSYVGGFALQLAKGCQKVTAVEISEATAPLIRANAFDFLKEKTEAAERFDIVVLDPPAFAKNKSSIAAAERGYKEINLRALQLLSPGGVLVSASCSFHIDEDHFEEILRSAAADARRDVQIVEKRGAGRDHPVLLGVKETRYLKCFILRAA